MKKIIQVLSVSFVLLGYTHAVNADRDSEDIICYEVDGEVQTNNISPTQQFGNILFYLTNQETGEEIELEGALNGMIIGGDAEGAVYLSHTASSINTENPFTFITINDKAVITGGLDGCTVPVSETITRIVRGTGFTKRVRFVDIEVNGSINVINEGPCLGVPNTFKDISGKICLKQRKD